MRDGYFSTSCLACHRSSSSRASCCSSSLLIFVAYHPATPTARSGRRCSCAAGPTSSGPCGLLQTFADLLKFVLKEPVIPAGANKGVFLLAPLVTAMLALSAWAVIPARRRLGDRQHQCRHPLHLRHLLARRLRRHHGRLGVELEISVPRRAALGRADGVLRSLDRLRHHHRAALRRLAEPHRHRARSAGLARWLPGLLRLVLAAAVPDVHHLLHLGAGRDEPPALRSRRGRIGARRRLHGRIFLDAVPAVHARRICRHRH